MAGTLLSEDKAGNVTNCNPNKSEDERKAYCNQNFVEFP